MEPPPAGAAPPPPPPGAEGYEAADAGAAADADPAVPAQGDGHGLPAAPAGAPEAQADAFLDDMAEQAMGGSGLLIAAAGMGIHVVAAKLCLHELRCAGDAPQAHPQQQQQQQQDTPDAPTPQDGPPRTLVLVLNTTAEGDAFLDDWLLEQGVPLSGLPRRVPIGMRPEAREQVYRTATVCVATSRHLVVDILQGRFPVHRLKGCIVCGAHTVSSEDTPVAFILRLLRDRVAAMLANTPATTSTSTGSPAPKRSPPPKSAGEAGTPTRHTPTRVGSGGSQGGSPAAAAAEGGGVPESPPDPEGHIFVRCLTDSPDAFTRGKGNRLQLTLRHLTVRKVWLWPRFHLRAEACLKRCLLEVVEMQGSMPRSVAQIQQCLVGVIGEVVSELRSRLQHLLPPGGGAVELTSAGVVSGLLNRYLQAELGSRLDKLPADVLSLLEELETLRRLLRTLHTKTSIEFYEAAERALLKAEGRVVNGNVLLPAFWLHASGAKMLLPHAKSRLLRRGQVSLEKESKFATLFEVLRDIQGDWRERGGGAVSLRPGDTFTGATRPTALILCKDRHAQVVVSQVLHRGEAFVLNYMMRRYVAFNYTEGRTLAAQLKTYHPKEPGHLQSIEVNTPRRAGGYESDEEDSRWRGRVSRTALAEIADAAPKAPIPFGALDVTEEDVSEAGCSLIGSVPCIEPRASLLHTPLGVAGPGVEEPATVPFDPTQDDATQLGPGELAEMNTLRWDSDSEGGSDVSEGGATTQQRMPDTQPLLGNATPPAAKRRRKGDGSLGGGGGGGGGGVAAEAQQEGGGGGVAGVGQKQKQQQKQKSEHDILAAEMDKYFGVFGAGSGPSVVVHTHQGSASLVDTLQPTWVVLYDPSIAAIRNLEVYSARHRDWRTKVYVLGHADSTEQQRSYTELNNEVKAFKMLARARASLPHYHVTYGAGGAQPAGGGGVRAPKSRRAGGLLQTLSANRRVLVDLREFRSKLPSGLHRNGLVPVPVHLEVADYVLSPDIGVERKSLPDLMGSLASGRLLQQVERLAKRYPVPVLLIEFEAGRQFCMTDTVKWNPGREVFTQHSSHTSMAFYTPPTPEEKTRALLDKLGSLAVLCPTLRIWWSRGQDMSARLFEAAKSGRQDPDEGDTSETVDHSADAIAFLRRLPGVTEQNITLIVESFDTIADLTQAAPDRLATMLGEAGLHLFRALHDS